MRSLRQPIVWLGVDAGTEGTCAKAGGEKDEARARASHRPPSSLGRWLETVRLTVR
jgi:hypothetical protein